MSADPKPRKNFWFNLDLVIRETRRWPVASTIVATVVGALIAVQAISEPHSDAIYVLVSVIGILSGGLGMKAFVHLMTYAMAHKSPFPGSYLVSTAITMIPIFVFYACGFYMMGAQQNDYPPIVALLILFGLGYPLSTIFFTGVFRAQEWIQLNRQKTYIKK